MRKLHGKDATVIYTPKEGHSVVIYKHKFKPEHFSDGVNLVMANFPDAQLKSGQKRHNIFLKHPSRHELVNVTFFDEGANVDEWQNAEVRLETLEKLQPMLDGPIDIQVYEVAGVVGVGE